MEEHYSFNAFLVCDVYVIIRKTNECVIDNEVLLVRDIFGNEKKYDYSIFFLFQ